MPNGMVTTSTHATTPASRYARASAQPCSTSHTTLRTSRIPSMTGLTCGDHRWFPRVRRPGAEQRHRQSRAMVAFRLHEITIDCLDVPLVAQFWAGLLGGEPF